MWSKQAEHLSLSVWHRYIKILSVLIKLFFAFLKNRLFCKGQLNYFNLHNYFQTTFGLFFPVNYSLLSFLLKKLQELFISWHCKFLLLVVLLTNPISCLSGQSAYHPPALILGNFVFLTCFTCLTFSLNLSYIILILKWISLFSQLLFL